jgi:hypothetical protein
MSATMLFALLFQALSVILLRHCLGKTWLRRPATILVLVSVAYQGVSPLLLLIPSIKAKDNFRLGITESAADNVMLLLSAAMLAFTVAYLLTRPDRVGQDGAAVRTVAAVLDWRLLALGCAPLAVLTYEGRGYNSGVAAADATTGDVLAASFFVILVALTAFSLVLRQGRGWFLPVLAAQSLLLAAAGERTPVITDAIVLVVMLCYAGMRPPLRQLQAAVALTVIAVLAVTGVRSVTGRSLFYRDSGLSARVSALGEGALAAATTGVPVLAAELAKRMDGVAFAAGILQSESRGQPRLPAVGVPESLLLAVPSALWTSKLAHSAALAPVTEEAGDFGLQEVNFLPGLPGMYAGFLSPAALIVMLAVLGLVAGWGERWLLRSCTPARVVMLAGALRTALLYEQGLQGMLLALRGALVIALAVKASVMIAQTVRWPVGTPRRTTSGSS